MKVICVYERIRNLEDSVAKVVGKDGGIKFDLSKPDEMHRKWMDSSRFN
jgi:hypothetical protein